MSKRSKRKRRGHFEPRVTKVEGDRAQAAKEALFNHLYTPRMGPRPISAVDLLRAGQDNPPLVVR